MLQKNSQKRGIAEKVGIVVIILLVILIVCTFFVYGMFKDVDAAPSLFGYRIYIMNNDTLGDNVKKGSAVFVKEGLMPTNEGNIILVSCPDTEEIPDSQGDDEAAANVKNKLAIVSYCGYHEVTMPDGSVQIKHIVKYGNAPDDNRWLVNTEDIIGKATSYDTTIGAIIRFVSSKVGMLVMVIIPCGLIVIYEVIMLLISIKRKRIEEENDYGEFPGYLETSEVQNPDDVKLNFGSHTSKESQGSYKEPHDRQAIPQFGSNNTAQGARTADKSSYRSSAKPTPTNAPFESGESERKVDTAAPAYSKNIRKASSIANEEVRRSEPRTTFSGSNTANTVNVAATVSKPVQTAPTSFTSSGTGSSAANTSFRQPSKPASNTNAAQPTASVDKRDSAQRIDELMRMLKEETEKLSGK